MTKASCLDMSVQQRKTHPTALLPKGSGHPGEVSAPEAGQGVGVSSDPREDGSLK